jgi:TPR repeat protein
MMRSICLLTIVMLFTLVLSNASAAAETQTERLLALASKGDVSSQFELAQIYERSGSVKSEQMAFYWYQQAAEHGHVGAQNNLAVMYDKGKWIKRDHVEAVKWYRRAAERSHAEAQFNLGLKYLRGEGVDQSDVMAHMWWTLSAKKSKKADEAKKILERRMTPQQIEESLLMAEGVK